uniref:Uncharacterized protein n=1 Tax=Arundo donax TaxID=35708 RepID=A0A0A8ZR62_ARUDO
MWKLSSVPLQPFSHKAFKSIVFIFFFIS